MFVINENCLNKKQIVDDDKLKDLKIYTYSGLNKLYKNIDNILNDNNVIENFYICGYRVDNVNLFPFLNFLLKNDLETRKLTFPSYKPNAISNDIIFKIKNSLNSIFYNIIEDNKYDFKGYYYYKNNVYVFFDFTNCKLIINNIHKNSIIWPVLIDEIVNKKNVCNIKINSDVIDFFNGNLDFTFLKDNNEKIIEIPSVVYIGKEFSKTNFTYVFGVSKPDNDMLFGPYYYFTNFKNAVKQGGWSEITNEKYNKGGVVRFAIFMGSTKVILNNSSGTIDESYIKKQLLSTNKLYENLTLRITDYDGKWSNNYDSIYVGEIELDNGEKMKNTPIYVVKKYEQQIPLSYHFIDKRLLDNKFDPNKDYQIL